MGKNQREVTELQNIIVELNNSWIEKKYASGDQKLTKWSRSVQQPRRQGSANQLYGNKQKKKNLKNKNNNKVLFYFLEEKKEILMDL